MVMSTKSKQIIAIDIDDVIAASTESLRLAVNERHNAALTPEHYQIDADYWGYYERVWEMHGLEVDFDDLNQDMAHDQSHVPLLPGATFAIGELSKKFDIVLVTSRDPAWEKATLEWLKRHFGDVFSAVHFAGNSKHNGTLSKGELCKQAGAFLLIDDNPEHCRSAIEHGLEAVLFGSYGWHTSTQGLHICQDWPQLLEYINGRF